ncbi:MAG: Hsp20/alpha crystallin family protein [Victivallales bacterium]|nr:Hsp20/alpha crystallin family protein [Victivallales bacterium]MCF7889318.1 Hsp20/alpha crystallin family protein [Victivallales bacterium]
MWNLLNFDNPFGELRNLHSEVNKLFNSYGSSTQAYPAVNIYGDEEELTVLAEIPGIKKEDIDLTVQGDKLTIEGERKKEENKENVVHREERGYGKFIRTFSLPYDVENEKITAKYKKGILEVTLPRAETSKPQKIKVLTE